MRPTHAAWAPGRSASTVELSVASSVSCSGSNVKSAVSADVIQELFERGGMLLGARRAQDQAVDAQLGVLGGQVEVDGAVGRDADLPAERWGRL